MLARFFWANGHATGIHWRKKATPHHPKGLGGLGIRSIGALNQALLMKQVWRIQNTPHFFFRKCILGINSLLSIPLDDRGVLLGLLKASQTLLSHSV